MSRRRPALGRKGRESAKPTVAHLVDLMTGDQQVPFVRFDTAMTVLTGLDADAALRLGRLVGAVVGGRAPDGVDATFDIDGRHVEIRDLPPLGSDLPVVLTRDDVEAHEREQALSAQAAHERRIADLDARALELGAQIQVLEEAVVDLSRRGEEIDTELAELRAWLAAQATARDIADAARSVRAAQRLPAPPPRAAVEVADRWDEFVLLRSAAELGDDPHDLAQATARVDRARAVLAEIDATTEGVSIEAAEHIQQLHGQVEALELELDRAKRGRRRQVEADLEAANAREFEALARYGFPSRAAFLVALAQGTGADDVDARAEAVAELEDALSLERAQRSYDATFGGRRISEVETELRSRAAELLDHIPPADVSGALRALRVEPPDLVEARARLRARMVELVGDLSEDDEALVRQAEGWVEQNAPASRDETSDAEVRLVGLEAESSALAERISSRRLKVASARREREHVEEEAARMRAEPLPSPADQASRVEVVDSLVATARPPGTRVPLVLTGLFRGLSSVELDELLARLAERAAQFQVIVVCEVDGVARWAQSAGSAVSLWTPEDAQRVVVDWEKANRARRAQEAAAARARQQAEEERAEAERAQRAREAEEARRRKALEDQRAPDATVPVESAPPRPAPRPEPPSDATDLVARGPSDVGGAEPEKPKRRRRSRAQEIEELQARAEQRRRERRERLERYGSLPESPSEPAARPRSTKRAADELSSGEAPWARFEAEVERRREAGEPDVGGLTVVQMCPRHRAVRAETACDRCGERFCDQCLLPVRSDILCIDCALIVSGVSTRRRR